RRRRGIRKRRNRRASTSRLSMTTRRAVCLAVSLALAALCVPMSGQTPTVDPNLSALADTERAFAKLGAEKGVRASFMQYFAPDGIWSTPHPNHTVEELKKRPTTTGPLPRKLEWAPVYGDIARSGELGYDMGPTRVTDLTPAKEAPHYGSFFSIWRKQPDGS